MRQLINLYASIFLLLFSQGAFSQECVTFYVASQYAQIGDTVQVDVRVRDFYDMAYLFFEMGYHPDELEFIQASNFGLPELSQTDLFVIEPLGEIYVSWGGESLPNELSILNNDDILFTLSFEVLSLNPQGNTVSFNSQHNEFGIERLTPIGLTLISASFIDGRIYDNSSPMGYPTIETACVYGSNCNANSIAPYINIEVSGGTPPYLFNWTNSFGTTYSSQNLSNIPIGTYHLLVTDQAGMQCSAVASLQEHLIGIIGIEINHVSCLGNPGSIHLPDSLLNTEYSYSWNTGDTTNIIENLEQGPYSVTFTNNLGCAVENAFYISAYDHLQIGVNLQQPLCGQSNGYIELTVPNPSLDYSFNWDTGDQIEDLYNLPQGYYHVTVTELSSGCFVERGFILQDEPFNYTTLYNCQATADPDSTNLILTTTILSGGIPPYHFDWSNGTSSQGLNTTTITETIGSPETYAVTVSDQSGCIFDPILIQPECSAIDSQSLRLSITSDEVEVGESFCLDVKVHNFSDILTTQFSIGWNPDLLQFDSLSNFNLPFLSTNNFGTPADGLSDGSLALAWIDELVSGISVNDNTTIFQICFTAKQAGLTQVFFSNNPTIIEMINLDWELLTPTLSNGIIIANGPSLSYNLLINANEATVQEGGSACVDITTNQVEGLADLQFNLIWDTTKLQFETIQNFNLPGLDTSNFGTSDALAGGQLHFQWEDESGLGASLNQGSSLFELCFTAIDGPAEVPLYFSNDPLPITAHHISSDSFNIFTINGNIVILSENTPPVQLVIEDKIGIPEQEVCLPLRTKDFTDVGSMQFSLAWDNNSLSYNTIHPVDLTGLDLNNFDLSQTANGYLTVNWTSLSSSGSSLPDGATLFEVCFLPVGPPGVVPVAFSNYPLPIQFKDDQQNNLPFLGLAGNVVIPAALVWPGDTDDNQLVDHFDLLNIGLAFGATGPVRENATLAWVAQYTEPWMDQTPESWINFKHADTDGDGIVNANDTLAIVQNWGEESEFWEDASERNSIPIYIQPDTVNTGETSLFDIMLGDEDHLVEGAYGLAFSITYDATAIHENSVEVSFEDSWLGDINIDKLGIYQNQADHNRVDVAVTRTDHMDRQGFGKIGALKLDIPNFPISGQGYDLIFNVENVRLINSEELELSLAPLSTTSLIQDQNTTGIVTPKASSLEVYPNPTKGPFYIKTLRFKINQLVLYSIQGQQLSNWTKDLRELNISHLPNGIYLLQIIGENGVSNFKINKRE